MTKLLLAFAALLASSASATAVSLGDMAQTAAADLEVVPVFIELAFYLVGVLIVGFALLKFKRHIDQPQQSTLGSGIIALVVGVALIAAPAVINGLSDTFGLGGQQTINRPKL